MERCCHSDHNLIVAHLQLDEIKEKGTGVWKNNISVFKNDVFKDEFGSLWGVWKVNSGIYCPIKFWVWAKKRIKGFLQDVGKMFQQQKMREKKEEHEYFQNMFRNQNGDSEVEIQNYLAQKKD